MEKDVQRIELWTVKYVIKFDY